MTKVVFSLHDQATELTFPPCLAARVGQLFGAQNGFTGTPGRRISITERGADRFAIRGNAQGAPRWPDRA